MHLDCNSARPAPTRPVDELVDAPRGLALWRPDDVAEGVELHRGLGVPEPLLDDHGVDADLEQQAEIAEAVELDVDLSKMQGLVYRPVAEEEHDALRWKAALAAERLHAALHKPHAAEPGDHQAAK